MIAETKDVMPHFKGLDDADTSPTPPKAMSNIRMSDFVEIEVMTETHSNVTTGCPAYGYVQRQSPGKAQHWLLSEKKTTNQLFSSTLVFLRAVLSLLV